jgi:two-component system response regulator FixJ
MNDLGLVLVVDDDESISQLIEATLRSEQLSVKAFPSAEAFSGTNVRAEAGDRPVCLLLDLVMPGQSGLDILEKQFAGKAPCPVIVMTARGTVGTAVKSMKLGAVDFLEKPFTPEALKTAVREALSKDASTREQVSEAESIRARLANLSPRERELLDAIVQGNSTKMIADALGISARTVDHHRANLMAKMHATNVADLVRMAVRADYRGVQNGKPPRTP